MVRVESGGHMLEDDADLPPSVAASRQLAAYGRRLPSIVPRKEDERQLEVASADKRRRAFAGTSGLAAFTVERDGARL